MLHQQPIFHAFDWAESACMGRGRSRHIQLMHVLQGLAMQRLILAMAERDGIDACDFEFVMVAGHFLARDENIFTFFEGVQVKPPEPSGQQMPVPSVG